jgi:hypothetical protein
VFVKVSFGQAGDLLLFAFGDALSRVSKTTGTITFDLDEGEHVAILRNQVDFAATETHVSVQNQIALAQQSVFGDPLTGRTDPIELGLPPGQVRLEFSKGARGQGRSGVPEVVGDRVEVIWASGSIDSVAKGLITRGMKAVQMERPPVHGGGAQLPECSQVVLAGIPFVFGQSVTRMR